MPNICFLLGGFQGNGGIGRVTSILANAISDIPGYTVTTLAYVQKENVPHLYELSEKIHSYYLLKDNVSMTKAFLKQHIVKRTRKVLKEEKIDILIACGALFFPLGILAVKNLSTRCYCWEHTNPETGSDYRFQRICRKLAVKAADRIVVITKAAEKYYCDILKASASKVVQIYNPISDEAAKSQKYNSNSHMIISVGRLSYPKNFSLLLDIAAKVLPRYPEWTWDIYGTGEEFDSLSAKIADLSLGKQVCLKGQVSNIYELYGKYAFQVMTSRYEGFPMSLLEGASNGLPLISFDIKTGPNEIINDGENGFLIPENNAEKMEEKIEYLIEHKDERERISNAAFNSMKKFSMNNILQQWRSICQM